MSKTAAPARYAASAGQRFAGRWGAGWPGRFTEHGNRDAVAQESRDLRRFRCRFPGWVTGAAGPVSAQGHACGMITWSFGVS